jgi:hypothetical protein
MYKTISNAIIRKLHPCYDPSKFITDENEELTVRQWVEKYRNIVPTKDIIWLLVREEFLSEKDLRLFAVWCARKALKLIEDPDKRSVEAYNVVERYSNGEATKDELDAAHNVANAAYYAALDATRVAYYVARVAYYAAVANAANAALAVANADNAANAAANAARSAQIDQLLTYFE